MQALTPVMTTTLAEPGPLEQQLDRRNQWISQACSSQSGYWPTKNTCSGKRWDLGFPGNETIQNQGRLRLLGGIEGRNSPDGYQELLELWHTWPHQGPVPNKGTWARSAPSTSIRDPANMWFFKSPYLVIKTWCICLVLRRGWDLESPYLNYVLNAITHVDLCPALILNSWGLFLPQGRYCEWRNFYEQTL